MNLPDRLRKRADELYAQGNVATAPLLEEAADALEQSPLNLSLNAPEIVVLLCLGGIATGIMTLAFVAVINLAI